MFLSKRVKKIESKKTRSIWLWLCGCPSEMGRYILSITSRHHLPPLLARIKRREKMKVQMKLASLPSSKTLPFSFRVRQDSYFNSLLLFWPRPNNTGKMTIPFLLTLGRKLEPCPTGFLHSGSLIYIRRGHRYRFTKKTLHNPKVRRESISALLWFMNYSTRSLRKLVVTVKGRLVDINHYRADRQQKTGRLHTEPAAAAYQWRKEFRLLIKPSRLFWSYVILYCNSVGLVRWRVTQHKECPRRPILICSSNTIIDATWRRNKGAMWSSFKI